MVVGASSSGGWPTHRGRPRSDCRTRYVALHRPTSSTTPPAYAATRCDARALRVVAPAPSRAGTAALAQALHDHAIDQALDRLDRRAAPGRRDGRARRSTAGRAGVRRGRPARRRCSARAVVATGGGPGAMEAANLGGRLAAPDRGRVGRGTRPARRRAVVPPVGRRLGRAAFAVGRVAGRLDTRSGIPTWHYGHEPPNVFATAIAKYFRNATREAILLQVCDAGIVFLPGAAGTVQEIFQDACENYYADEASVAPMVLVGASYWTTTVPAGRCCSRSPAAGRWSSTSTSSTPSTRPPACSPMAWRLRVRPRWRRAGRRRRRSRGRGCRGRWSGRPCASSRRTNSRSSAGSEAVHFEPGVGLSGIRLTCTQPQSPERAEDVAEQVGAPGLVVDAAHHGVLDRDAALGDPGVVPGRVDGLVDRPAGVDRHQLVAQLVVGRVQRQRQRHRDALVGELAASAAPGRRSRP